MDQGKHFLWLLNAAKNMFGNIHAKFVEKSKLNAFEYIISAEKISEENISANLRFSAVKNSGGINFSKYFRGNFWQPKYLGSLPFRANNIWEPKYLGSLPFRTNNIWEQKYLGSLPFRTNNIWEQKYLGSLPFRAFQRSNS